MIVVLTEPAVVSSRMMNRIWQAVNKKGPQTEFAVFVCRGRGHAEGFLLFLFLILNTFSFRNVFRISKRQSSPFQVKNEASTEGFNFCYNCGSQFISTPFKNIKRASC